MQSNIILLSASWIFSPPLSFWTEECPSLRDPLALTVRNLQFHHWARKDCRIPFRTTGWHNRFLAFRQSGRQRWFCFPCFCSWASEGCTYLSWCEFLGSSKPIEYDIFRIRQVLSNLSTKNLSRFPQVTARSWWWLRWGWRLDFWHLHPVGSNCIWTQFSLLVWLVSTGWMVWFFGSVRPSSWRLTWCLREGCNTHELDVFDSGTCLSCKFRLNMIVLVGFRNFFIQNRGFPWLVADRFLLHFLKN